MSTRLRKPIKLNNKILIIKLSSMAVTLETGGINRPNIKKICKDIHFLASKKKLKIVIVSSGAINLGKSQIKNLQSSNISHLQAASAIGQPILMHEIQRAFSKYDLKSAQVLLTHEDLKNKKRTLNIRSSLLKLIEEGIIPVINENDCVSFDEITVGDNDQLSAMICETLNADTLCMLTRTNGLYTEDPSKKEAIHIPYIAFDEDFSKVKTLTKSAIGRGGMKTKLQAVRKLTPLGVSVFIGSYEGKSPIKDLLTQNDVGTFFEASPTSNLSSKKLWILNRAKTNASINIDKGAMEALSKNSSLLPIGIKSISGKFSRGDCIQISYQKKIIGYGITEYDSKDIELIKKLKTNELEKALKNVHSKVVVHINNFILQTRG